MVTYKGKGLHVGNLMTDEEYGIERDFIADREGWAPALQPVALFMPLPHLNPSLATIEAGYPISDVRLSTSSNHKIK